MNKEYSHYWRIKKWLPERFSQRCRILKTGSHNSVLIEFKDGFKVITIRYFLRREMRQEAGNIYNLVGIAKYALIAAGQGEKVDALIDDVYNNSKSYDDAIKNIKNT